MILFLELAPLKVETQRGNRRTKSQLQIYGAKIVVRASVHSMADSGNRFCQMYTQKYRPNNSEIATPAVFHAPLNIKNTEGCAQPGFARTFASHVEGHDG